MRRHVVNEGEWRRRVVVAASVIASAAALAGCASDNRRPEQPSFYRSLAQAGVSVDAEAAASMISGYRSNQGLNGVVPDPALMKVAQAQAQAMAARDRLDRNIGGSLNERLRRAGAGSATSAENVSAGYHTLAEAFSGWRDSPPHRANMLLKGATRMGIATAYAPASKYKVFWSLILSGSGGDGG